MSKEKLKKPQEAHEDKPEDERKYKIRGASFSARAEKLKAIFNHVAGCKNHFVTLDQHLHAKDFDPELVAAAEYPFERTPLRTRYYWASKTLAGYLPTSKKKVEIRTERKLGKGVHQQVVKIGQESVGTLRRGEYKRLLDGFGTNLDIYPAKIKKAAHAVLGMMGRKPLVKIEGQSIKVLYHPDGRQDMLFEIKFDLAKGRTFDGYKRDIVELEIEVKEIENGISEDEIDSMLDKTEAQLMAYFADDLEPINHSKVYELVQHLYGWISRDKAGFEKAFKSLPGWKWGEFTPS